ncbi:hypothetical protein P171DRAFT_470455 [Karstenula rhodostoma CBS 690.94]|uniref:Uncharacterized protein n=1 Tax=Karstenula rhodostoma CBS 690.94 TaxID=1392251 RepID=A0A9P4PRC6_9PLEO|nr:hypothetical protein P171DRAFT_470455 [Karstenula rhodostoma CBS 690.94]
MLSFAGCYPYRHLHCDLDTPWGTCPLWRHTAPPRLRNAIDLALQLVATKDGFSQVAQDAFEVLGVTVGSIEEFLHLSPKPWHIPTEADLHLYYSIYRPGYAFHQQHYDSEKHYYSAAALAIDFLGSHSPKTRCQMRELVLLEDCKGVGFPESHPAGLIPFFQENNRLRILRRLDLWRSEFPLDTFSPEVTPDFISMCMIPWIDEAYALAGAGMPSRCFKLQFHASNTHLQLIFDMLKRDAALHEAYQACCGKDGIQYAPDKLFIRYRNGRCFLSDVFPLAMRGIVQGSSTVQIDAEKGGIWDTAELAEVARGWTIEQWDDWKQRTTGPSITIDDYPVTHDELQSLY